VSMYAAEPNAEWEDAGKSPVLRLSYAKGSAL
jgi:hypothetical protein